MRIDTASSLECCVLQGSPLEVIGSVEIAGVPGQSHSRRALMERTTGSSYLLTGRNYCSNLITGLNIIAAYREPMKS